MTTSSDLSAGEGSFAELVGERLDQVADELEATLDRYVARVYRELRRPVQTSAPVSPGKRVETA